ncbi:MAG: acetoin dehydrogenase dihydrolipoyllysine-residue acetyltransferase subunit [Granulosicoccus sp.]
MPIEVIMPKVDMDMDKGTIMSWHVMAGDKVAKGQPLFVIETDKAAMEVEAQRGGVIHHLAAEGEEVLIGQPVAWLYADDEAVGEPLGTLVEAEVRAGEVGDTAVADAPVAHAVPEHGQLTNSEPVSGAGLFRATPRARSLLRETGIDPATIAGSGPRGRIQAADVQQRIHPANAHGVSITRSERGSDIPLVFIHGFASDAMSWAPLEQYLKHRSVMRIELPGHGRSATQTVEDFGSLVRRICAAFDELYLQQAHLIGHSLGGALSVSLAENRPRNIASLTLIAPAGLGPDINGDIINGICRATRAASLAPWLRQLVYDESLVTDSYVRSAMSSRSAPDRQVVQAAMAEALFPDGVQAIDVRTALHRLEAPSRIIWGKADKVIPWRHALNAPGMSGLHLLQNTGHIPHIECAEAVGRIIGMHIGHDSIDSSSVWASSQGVHS